MNKMDIDKLQKFNERYGPTNLTGFRFVGEKTSVQTVMDHIKIDLLILNSSDVKFKQVYRIVVRKDCIDIATVDNGAIISYFFLEDAVFKPQSIKDDVKGLCNDLKVMFEEIE